MPVQPSQLAAYATSGHRAWSALAAGRSCIMSPVWQDSQEPITVTPGGVSGRPWIQTAQRCRAHSVRPFASARASRRTLSSMDLGPSEVIVILLVVVLLFGAKKLPELARGAGQSLRIFKEETRAARTVDEGPNTTPPADHPVGSGGDASR